MAQTILAVDDHADTVRLLARLLSTQYQVMIATGIVQAKQLAATMTPDLLLTDIELHDGDGCDLFVSLKAKNPHLKAIACSGHKSAELFERCRSLGFAEFIVKPTEYSKLVGAIARALAHQSVH